MGNGRGKRKLPAALGPSKHRVRELLCGARPAPCGEGLDPGTSAGDVTTFAYQAGKKKESGAHIFCHLKPEVCLRSLQSATEFYACRGGLYFEHPLNTLRVGVSPVLERCVYSDK